MAEVSIPHAIAGSSTSPPPNCAICLGTCTNKCFSDSCMHQFCFTCLLEWSKVKAECPLCKQHFTSIIHNVKSNNEFDEYIVEPSVHTRQDVMEEDYFLPTTAHPPRHFQFRTTFTVDPRGELAIQQMLLTHRLTNSAYSPNYSYGYNRNFRHRHRRDVSSTNFRRSVYARNMWVAAPPDITGRYRDISPLFYRENPAAINRLVPWLNRELNALLEENTQQVMALVDVILGHLNRHHIRGYFFKSLLREFLASKTEHFIHEFYNFMKSPYDMVGYDRHVSYYPRNSFIHTIPSEDSSSSSDSDITVVATTSAPNPNPFHRPTLEVIEINSDSSRDSDVIIHEPPPPVVVDLINTSDDDDAETAARQEERVEAKKESSSDSDDVKPKYGNLLHKKEKKSRVKYEKSKKKRKTKSSRYIYTSSESESDSSSDSKDYKYYKRRKQKSVKKSRSKQYSSSSSSENSTDDEPLSEKVRKMKESSRKSKRKEKLKTYHKHKSRRSSTDDDLKDNRSNQQESQSKSARYNYSSEESQPNPQSNHTETKPNVAAVPPSSSSSYDHHNNSSNHYQEQETKYDSDKPLDFSMAAFAGPSYRSSDSPKKERYHLWYSRPRWIEYDSSSSSN